MLHSRARRTRTVNGQFISYLADSGFRRLSPDHYERHLRRRRMALAVFFWATIVGFAWVVLESAHALSMF